MSSKKEKETITFRNKRKDSIKKKTRPIKKKIKFLSSVSLGEDLEIKNLFVNMGDAVDVSNKKLILLESATK